MNLWRRIYSSHVQASVECLVCCLSPVCQHTLVQVYLSGIIKSALVHVTVQCLLHSLGSVCHYTLVQVYPSGIINSAYCMSCAVFAALFQISVPSHFGTSVPIRNNKQCILHVTVQCLLHSSLSVCHHTLVQVYPSGIINSAYCMSLCSVCCILHDLCAITLWYKCTHQE